MKILLAADKNQTMPNYCHALDCLGVSYEKTLNLEAGADALLLPGGGDLAPWRYHEAMNGSIAPNDALDEQQLALFKRFFEEGRPIFGICRGCQLINVALGGSLVQHLPHAQDHTQTPEKKDSIHGVISRDGSIVCRLYGDAFRVNSSHHQACKAIGHGLRVTAFAEDGTIEAVEHEELPIFGVQWHPERIDFGWEQEGVARGRALFDYFLSLI